MKLLNVFRRGEVAGEPLIEFREELVATLTPNQVRKLAKTTNVLVEPPVLTRFIDQALKFPKNEIGGLLIGRVDGRFLVVTDLVFAEKPGTLVNVWFGAADFERAAQLASKSPGGAVVGWAHSHPGHGVFMSTTDHRHQAQGQDLFADYIALVVDPFRHGSIAYGFFRNDHETSRELPYSFVSGEVQ